MSRAGKPEVVELTGGPGDDDVIARAARLMADGGLVAFPTDTVYGVGTSPALPEAIDRICAAKGRDRSKKLARLAADAEAASRLVGEWPELASKLARACWPGPLTIVVGGVGVRVPASRVARELARGLGGALVATSANRSGGPEPRTATEVAEALGTAVEMILDGGRTGGVPSTVVRVTVAGQGTAAGLEILREGAIAAGELERIAGTSEAGGGEPT